MNIHKKLQQARIKLQNTALKKSGHNKFAGYTYFELGDFLPAIQRINDELGLCGTVSFTPDMAYLTIYDTDSTESNNFVTFTSPMASAALKGCHDVQNLGAVQTYLRRYLWVNAFEIVEHDALEPLTGKEEPAKKPEPVAKPAPVATQPAVSNTAKGAWSITMSGDEGSEDWFKSLEMGVKTLLTGAQTPDDVATIFKTNRVLFDKVKELDAQVYSDLMTNFSTTKKALIKE
jgi:hypothetical protein